MSDDQDIAAGKASYRTEGDCLWCVRLEGPDDVIAQASREAADAYAEQHRAMVKRLIARDPGLERDGITEASMRAIVEPWPWSAEAHAKALMEDADAE